MRTASPSLSTSTTRRLAVGGGEQYEVFVTRYYDRTKGDGSDRLHDNIIDGPFKARGKTLQEAWEKSADLARQWAKDQPVERS